MLPAVDGRFPFTTGVVEDPPLRIVSHETNRKVGAIIDAQHGTPLPAKTGKIFYVPLPV